MAEWGVKDAAQRLAKLLGAKGRKCEVVEGEGDWPVGLVVDGALVLMRQHELRIARGIKGKPIKNAFDFGYAHKCVMVSKFGKVDLAEVEGIIAQRKADAEKDAITAACRNEVAAIIANHPTLIHPLGSSGCANSSTTGPIRVRLGDKHTGTTTPGRMNISLDYTIFDCTSQDLADILSTLEMVRQRQNERSKSWRNQ